MDCYETLLIQHHGKLNYGPRCFFVYLKNYYKKLLILCDIGKKVYYYSDHFYPWREVSILSLMMIAEFFAAIMVIIKEPLFRGHIF